MSIEYIDIVNEHTTFKPICERCRDRKESIFVMDEEWVCSECLAVDEKARVMDQFGGGF